MKLYPWLFAGECAGCWKVNLYLQGIVNFSQMYSRVLNRIREAREKDLPQLDLSWNELRDTPALEGLLNLVTLDLDNNKLTDITRVAKLPSLKTLNLHRNELTDVSALHDLPCLTTLNLSSNRVKRFPALQEVPCLASIDLCHNGLVNLSLLKDLPNLTTLYLSGNKLTDISALKYLPNLTTLDLSGNKLTDVSVLKDLPNLTTLYLSDNKLTDLSALQELSNLRVLDLFRNELTDVSLLKKLLNLTVLDLSGNNLTDISVLKGLPNLTELDLSNNKLTDISVLKDLINLAKLDISWNNLTDITPIRVLLEKEIPLKWMPNPLTTPPPEIIEQGDKAVLRFLNEKEKGTHKINESRLLIVGQGGSGKTSLRTKLKDIKAPLPEPGDTTRGIETDILEYEVNGQQYKLRIWDFGGQNIQHYAHQFFLTDSSLYVLLTNEREQNPNFQYWLNIIEMLGGNSPVLIVQNEIAGHCETIQNMAGIRSRYGNVINTVYSVDLLNPKKDERFEKLKNEILHQASGLEHIHKEYPASYVKVRDRLDKEAGEEKPFITWNAYRNMCREEGIQDETLMKDIANTFSILGTCVYIKDDAELKQFVFLNPQWIIDALFALIYHPIVVEQGGEFSENDTEQIWTDNTYDNMHGKLLRMMERFELCYRIANSDRYIVPQRLPAATDTYNWQEKDTTEVLYRYEFMPKGIITRVTCRLHEWILPGHVWNDAVIFQNRGAKVFVREVYNEKRIAIEAGGKNKEDLLNRVIDAVDAIHTKSKIANLKVEKLVPCICNLCRGSKDPYFFNYDTLCLLLEEGETDERCQKSRKKVNIREVLHRTGIVNFQQKSWGAGGADMKGRYNEEAGREKIKGFISYSKSDARLKNKLLSQLASLKRTDTLFAWHDAELVPGENWDERIKAEIAGAQIVLLLVSANFIKTDYIWNVEVEKAYQRFLNGEKIAVVPIIINFCAWEGLPLAKYNVLPAKGVPVTNTRAWVNQDEAWLDVMRGIERVIEELKKR